MTETCQHCQRPVTDNFCPKCGQKKYKRIEKGYILDEIKSTFVYADKGFLYSILSILKNPGKTAKEFISGNRASHYKPIPLAFVINGISTLIALKLLNFKENMGAYYSQLEFYSDGMGDVMALFLSYNSLLMLLLIPFFALMTKIAFRKWGHNYYEHMVMNAYILSCYTLISIIVIYPILYFFQDNPTTFFTINLYTFLIAPFLLVWFFKGFYPDKSMKSIILRVLAIFGMLILGYVGIIILATIAVVVFYVVVKDNPEALQNLK